jgi:hypothetical protein
MFDLFAGVGDPVRPPVSAEAAAEAERLLGEALKLAPGAEQIAALALVNPDAADSFDAAELLVAWERCARWLSSQQAKAVVAVAGARPAGRDDFARERVRVALRGCGGSPRSNVDVARGLCGRLSEAGEALERGDLSYDHVRALTFETLLLDDDTAVLVAAAVLDERATRSTPAEFRRRVRAAVIAADPARAEDLARQAARRRQVSRWVEPDAQASLMVTGPAVAVQTIWTALDLRAADPPYLTGMPSMTADGQQEPPRTLDQRRFDALVDICREALADTYGPTGDTDPADSAGPAGAAGPGGAAGPAASRGTAGAAASGATRSGGVAGSGGVGGAGGSPCGCGEALRPNRAARRAHTRSSRRAGVRPQVFLFADAATWAGLAQAPVHLDGYGPIPAGIARDHFETSQWRAVVTDTVHGQPLAVSDTTYTPSPRTRRHLHVRDRTCGFPGCGAAVWFCDVDHDIPHADGGCTDLDNCGLFCRRHHRLKTFTPWTWARQPDGTLTWTDPSGREWERDPVRYLMPPSRNGDAVSGQVGSATRPRERPDDLFATDPPLRGSDVDPTAATLLDEPRGADPPPYAAADIPPF